jgi:hypothetical protein
MFQIPATTLLLYQVNFDTQRDDHRTRSNHSLMRLQHENLGAFLSLAELRVYISPVPYSPNSPSFYATSF